MVYAILLTLGASQVPVMLLFQTVLFCVHLKMSTGNHSTFGLASPTAFSLVGMAPLAGAPGNHL
jgi:hypothetical protein